MIVAIIGQSGSGKTHYAIENYFKEDMELYNEGIKYTSNKEICMIGDYIIDRRCKGTDTLSFNALPKIIEFIEKNKRDYEVIVVEGDRINNKRFFDFLMGCGELYKVYYIKADTATTLERIGAEEYTPFLKSTKTKSVGMLRYLVEKKANIQIVEN